MAKHCWAVMQRCHKWPRRFPSYSCTGWVTELLGVSRLAGHRKQPRGPSCCRKKTRETPWKEELGQAQHCRCIRREWGSTWPSKAAELVSQAVPGKTNKQTATSTFTYIHMNNKPRIRRACSHNTVSDCFQDTQVIKEHMLRGGGVAGQRKLHMKADKEWKPGPRQALSSWQNLRDPQDWQILQCHWSFGLPYFSSRPSSGLCCFK